jgi:hypothetical protein
MQQAMIAAFERALLNLLPRMEPLLIQAAKNIAKNLILAAKAKSLPDRYKWAEPIIDDVGDDLLKLITTA